MMKLVKMTKFYMNNASPIGNENAKFQLNLLKQTVATATFVASLQNTSISDLCGWRQRHCTKRLDEMQWSETRDETY